MNKLLIGADPEFFVSDGAGTIIPAVGMVAGTKYEPLACLRGAMQVDGLALEFNIDPAATVKEFDLNVRAVMRRTLMEARKNTGNSNLKVSKECYHRFNEREFEAIDDAAKALGCSVSYSSLGAINIPRSHEKQPVRVVGGHVHLGWLENADGDVNPNSVHFRDCARMAVWLDVFLQARLLRDIKDSMSRAEYSKFCKQERNRKVRYGKWSEFRAKPYGMEYRSLSNFWIHSSELRQKVFQYTQDAYQLALENPQEMELMFYSRGRAGEARTYSTYCLEGQDEYVENVLNTTTFRYLDKMLDKLEG